MSFVYLLSVRCSRQGMECQRAMRCVSAGMRCVSAVQFSLISAFALLQPELWTIGSHDRPKAWSPPHCFRGLCDLGKAPNINTSANHQTELKIEAKNIHHCLNKKGLQTLNLNINYNKMAIFSQKTNPKRGGGLGKPSFCSPWNLKTRVKMHKILLLSQHNHNLNLTQLQPELG